MSIVYVVQETLQKNRETGSWERYMDLSPAETYGPLEFLLPSERVIGQKFPLDPSEPIAWLTERLSAYTVDDYLLFVGNPFFIAVAGAVAARRTGGPVKVLVWQHQERRYRVVRTNFYGYEAHNYG